MPYWVFDHKSQEHISKRRRHYNEFFYDEDEATLTIIQRDLKSGDPILREGPSVLRDPISRLLLFFLQNCGSELQIIPAVLSPTHEGGFPLVSVSDSMAGPWVGGLAWERRSR